MTLQTDSGTTAAPGTRKLPPVTAPADAGITLAGVRQIPHGLVDPSPLNPRHSQDIDPGALLELASSILQQGVLQNLVVRPHPKKAGRYEIAAGERRWRAMAHLIHDGDLPKDATVPALVRDLTDRQLVELALTENVQRGDLTPMEEAAAFRRLVDLGAGTDEIADRVGCSRRHVQGRLALLKLHPDAQKLLKDGAIGADMARELTRVGIDEQKKVLPKIKNGWATDAQILRKELVGDLPEVKTALFPLDQYKGEIVEEEKRRLFGDVAQYLKLQSEALDARIAELRKKWAFVHVQRNTYFDKLPDNYQQAKKGEAGAGALVMVSPEWRVTVHTGLRKKPEKKTAAGKNTAAPAPKPSDYPAEFLEQIAMIKERAVQGAVLKRPDIVTRLALLGCRQIIDFSDPGAVDSGVKKAAAIVGRLPWGSDDAWKIVAKLSDKDAALALAGEVASYMVHPRHGQDPGEDGLFLQIAREVKADAAAVFSFAGTDGRELIKTAGVPQLMRMAFDLKIDPDQFTSHQGEEDLRHALISAAPKNPKYLPPWLAFGTPKEIEAHLKKTMPKGLSSRSPAKAAAKAAPKSKGKKK